MGRRSAADGLTYAAYAHRGAYPLIVTALLAAGSCWPPCRPGSATAGDPLIRGLVYAWVGQNVVLVISSILRLDLYVGIYALTYWRIAAFIWMGLVAAGLVAIVARIALGRSNRWLLSVNLLTLSATLYVSAFVNFAALIANYNVDHSRQMSSQGVPLDICYLESLGPAAFPAIDRYVAHRRARNTVDTETASLARSRADRERWYREDLADWRAWTFRDWRLMRYLDATPAELPSGGPTPPGRKTMAHRILVADDDPHIREIICFALEKAGMKPTAVADGAAALREAERGKPDLLVLDIGMPEMDGLEVCRRLRRGSDVPILFLSARDEEIDRVLGLEIGGDDYVTKPFSPRELVARVRVILRRPRQAPAEKPAPPLGWGKLLLDPARHAAIYDDQPLALTAIEFAILEALIARPGHVLSRDAMMTRAWAANIHVSERTVDSHVRNIRAKLAALGCGDGIDTVHGVGFRLAGAARDARHGSEHDAQEMAAAAGDHRRRDPDRGAGAAAGRPVLLPPLREPARAPDRGRLMAGRGARRHLPPRPRRRRHPGRKLGASMPPPADPDEPYAPDRADARSRCRPDPAAAPGRRAGHYRSRLRGRGPDAVAGPRRDPGARRAGRLPPARSCRYRHLRS